VPDEANWKVKSGASGAPTRQLAAQTYGSSPAMLPTMIDDNSPISDGSNRELSRRSNHGIEVVLLWCETTGLLTVWVCNQGEGTYFELNPPPALALDAFYHPYFYVDRGKPYYEDARLAA
jgi:hypothetical protein